MEKGHLLFLTTMVACFAPAIPTTTTITNSVVYNNNNTRDLDALLAFKATIVDPQNILPTNWSTSTSVCNWIGITCNSRHQRVAAIDLSGMELVGTIPPQLGNLSFLAGLSLLNNRFHGNLPKELAHLRRLKYINLAFNNFDGEFPSWLGALSQLRYLALFHNRFSGSLSPAVFNSTKLETIRLAENKLEGPLPQSLFNLSSLQHLSLTNNSLSGYLPARICDQLPQIHGIYLSANQFDGEIPSGIGDCSRLQILSLSINNLAGNIPRGLWNLTTLREIYLGANYDLQGEISRNIGNITNLKVLFIDTANLTGAAHERVSFFELQQITNGFNESNLLGSGTFGSVYKGIRANGMIWAIKVFNLELEFAFKSFDKECEVLSNIRHRNLTKVISACSNLDFKALVLEYMPNGSLEKCLYSDHHILNIMQRLDIMIDVACGLEYLHCGYLTPVVHCDLKPSNILLDQYMVGHISDFGITKLLGDGENVVQTETLATFGYTAPGV